MASYTMELREYIEMFSQDEQLSTREIIEKGRTNLFDFDYPIFDPAYKAVFETHFIRQFYMREIGAETEALFKFNLETWLLINMPYFNKLFESEQIKFDPLINSSMDTTYTKKDDKSQTLDSKSDGTVDKTSSQTADNFNRNLESNTPDSRLTITTNDGQGVIEYASNIEENTINNKFDGTGKDVSSVTGNSKSVANETETYIENRSGKIGIQTYSKMLHEYRDSFLRIEKRIFKEMQQLFMLVY